MQESFCMRNCFTKINVSLNTLTIEGTRAEKLEAKNLELRQKADPDFKNYNYDPLTKDLEQFKGRFAGGVDYPII